MSTDFIRNILRTLGLHGCDHQVELMQLYMLMHPNVPLSFLAKPLAMAHLANEKKAA